MKKYKFISILFICVTVFFINCSELQQLMQVQKPTLNVANVRMTGLSLQKIDLAFDVDIQNPNPVSVQLAGLDYDFQLNNNSFLRGNQNKGLQIQSNGKSRVEIPLSLGFQEIYETYQAFKNQDSTAYTLACGLTFQLPILGATRIPVQKSGYLPLIKLPRLRVNALKLDKLSFTGADLALELKMDNPNVFQLLLKNLNYHFNVNGLSWAKGNLASTNTVNPKSDGNIRIPISLNFIEMGKTVYQLVSGTKDLDYQFSGNLGLDTSLPILNNIDLPIDNSGSLKITK